MCDRVSRNQGREMLMRFVCLSDTHGKQNQILIPDGDVLIHAGDMGVLGNYDEYIKIGKWFESLKDRFKYRIFIAGNHDWSFWFNNSTTLSRCFDRDVIYLEDSYVTIEGITIYGSPWVPPFRNWAFMLDELDLYRKFENIHDDTDILITHSPPWGILDKNSIGQHCGSTALLNRITQLKRLRHHLFGHIHESHGRASNRGVEYYNVCILDHWYKISHPVTVFDWS